MERLLALLLLGGILLSSGVAGVHDPECPHHRAAAGARGQHGHGAGPEGHRIDSGPAEGGSAGTHAGHGDGAAHAGATSHDSSPEDCSCAGGLCALSVALPDSHVATGDAVGLDLPRESALVLPAEAVRDPQSTARLQPPATGPPAIV